MTTNNFEEERKFNRRYWSDYRWMGRITECFHHDKSSCKGDIKQSHSLQRNGRLSLIEGDDGKGNQVVYTFTNSEVDGTTGLRYLKPLGKATASTFFGFCDFHDTALFSPIENFSFNNSDNHCFLHSYRSFALSYHRHKEFVKFTKHGSHYSRSLPKHKLIEMLRCAELGIQEMEIEKRKLDVMLTSKSFCELEYLTYQIPEKFAIACSSLISPESSYKGYPMNNHSDSHKPFSQIMLTILPDENETIIIMACFSSDVNGTRFLNELDALADLPLKKAISSLMISKAENTFFAPVLWDQLGAQGQKQLCREFEDAVKSFRLPKGFVHTEVNFFDSKFVVNPLGIE